MANLSIRQATFRHIGLAGYFRGGGGQGTTLAEAYTGVHVRLRVKIAPDTTPHKYLGLDAVSGFPHNRKASRLYRHDRSPSPANVSLARFD